MDNTIVETFLDRLRKNTAVSHTQLEELPVSKSIMKPDVSSAEYITYLALMHDVVKDAETNVFPALSDIVTDMKERNKTILIEDDLKGLGHPKAGYTTLFENAQDYSIAFKLGIFYVIEGSSLGGRVILKNINAVLGHDETNGASYFSGYGNQTGSHWKSFLNTLVQYEDENNAEDEIIAGANFAFKTIAKHFTTQ